MYFKSIQLLRAFAAVLVTFFHALFFWNKENNFLSHLFDNMFGSIDLFFVISGFVVFQSARQSQHGASQFFVFMQRRLIRIYPVYWIIMLLFLATGMYYSGIYSWGQFYKSFFLLPVYPQFIRTTWTLQYEIYFYLLAGLYVLNGKFRFVFIALFFLWLISASHLQIGGNSMPVYGFYNEFIMEFFLGIAAFLFFKKIPFYLSIILLLTGCAFFLFSLQKFSSHLFSFGIPSAFIITGLTNLEYRNKIKIPGYLVIIGNASYILYLIHGPILEKIFSYLDSIHILNTAYILFSIVAVIIFSIIIHKYLEKPLINWLNRKAPFKSRQAA